MKQKLHRTTIMLTSEEVDFLDDLAYDFKKTSGNRIAKTAIIRAAINYLGEMDDAYRYAIIKTRIPDEEGKATKNR